MKTIFKQNIMNSTRSSLKSGGNTTKAWERFIFEDLFKLLDGFLNPFWSSITTCMRKIFNDSEK